MLESGSIKTIHKWRSARCNTSRLKVPLRYLNVCGVAKKGGKNGEEFPFLLASFLWYQMHISILTLLLISFTILCLCCLFDRKNRYTLSGA